MPEPTPERAPTRAPETKEHAKTHDPKEAEKKGVVKETVRREEDLQRTVEEREREKKMQADGAPASMMENLESSVNSLGNSLQSALGIKTSGTENPALKQKPGTWMEMAMQGLDFGIANLEKFTTYLSYKLGPLLEKLQSIHFPGITEGLQASISTLLGFLGMEKTMIFKAATAAGMEPIFEKNSALDTAALREMIEAGKKISKIHPEYTFQTYATTAAKEFAATLPSPKTFKITDLATFATSEKFIKEQETYALDIAKQYRTTHPTVVVSPEQAKAPVKITKSGPKLFDVMQGTTPSKVELMDNGSIKFNGNEWQMVLKGGEKWNITDIQIENGGLKVATAVGSDIILEKDLPELLTKLQTNQIYPFEAKKNGMTFNFEFKPITTL